LVELARRMFDASAQTHWSSLYSSVVGCSVGSLEQALPNLLIFSSWSKLLSHKHYKYHLLVSGRHFAPFYVSMSHRMHEAEALVSCRPLLINELVFPDFFTTVWKQLPGSPRNKCHLCLWFSYQVRKLSFRGEAHMGHGNTRPRHERCENRSNDQWQPWKQNNCLVLQSSVWLGKQEGGR